MYIPVIIDSIPCSPILLYAYHIVEPAIKAPLPVITASIDDMPARKPPAVAPNNNPKSPVVLNKAIAWDRSFSFTKSFTRAFGVAPMVVPPTGYYDDDDDDNDRDDDNDGGDDDNDGSDDDDNSDNDNNDDDDDYDDNVYLNR
jgi:hypothetical protein